ncbi:MAG: hypothetical protein OEZ59_08820 [Deltaproteobacteria bacterium]|nr:hypothetical protein [Deltaproteobacteria bacterium]
MNNTQKAKRPFICGVKMGGTNQYQVVIHGNSASKFPPIEMELSLGELGEYLRGLEKRNEAAAKAMPALRLVH